MNSLNELNDNQLWALSVSGNQKAFDKLFQRNFLHLCEYASRFRLTPDMIEEAVSDVFINLWIRKDDLQIKQIRPYLFTSVKNTSLNHLKSALKPILSFDQVDDSLLASNSRTDAGLTINDLRSEIEQYVVQLPSQQQNVFRLSKVEGFETNEIAEMLSISPKTVSNHLVEACKSIARHYQKVIQLTLILLTFN
ncbi:sigma-70 family RNA polymerase sigma factor [Fulvivirga ulvae]|uniref:sigma-70 family RNA polymerase sigma factor n=1 Tax=Fulvivirga ulvae TaxID=2904245 RepID=UPI001F26C164|nr:sigma-70 family RNA polymerase sigma factor [Fulvivirga ulvae]UII29912.1 sigma-70 family RNA polymerase sigma factor [Fulvivirga ulvae]